MDDHPMPVERGNRLHEVLDGYRQAKAQQKAAKRLQEELGQELLLGLGRKKALKIGDWVVSRRRIPAVPPVVVTAEMVGEQIGGRRGYLVLEVVSAEAARKAVSARD